MRISSLLKIINIDIVGIVGIVEPPVKIPWLSTATRILSTLTRDRGVHLQQRLWAKKHDICTKYESTAIPGASAGHGDNHHTCMSALNALIYRYTSIDKLEEKFQECREKYGHVAATDKILNSLQGNMKKLCRAYTQSIFSFNHTSTQRSEEFNDRVKSKKDMILFLTNTNLASLHDHINRLSIETDASVLKPLPRFASAELTA